MTKKKTSKRDADLKNMADKKAKAKVVKYRNSITAKKTKPAAHKPRQVVERVVTVSVEPCPVVEWLGITVDHGVAYGLGSDGKVYRWDHKSGAWKLHKEGA